MAFRGVDYFSVDSLFSEEELMVRQTARRFAEERILPADSRLLSRRALSHRADPGDGRARLPRRQPGRLWLRRHEQRRVRARSCRSWSASIPASAASSPCRARWSCTRSTPTAREEQKQHWLPRAAKRQGDRMLRPDRARFRLEPRRACAPPRAATAMPGSSTARRPGSPTARRPTSRWSGRAPRKASSASWWSAARPGYTTSDIHGKWSMRASVTSSLSFADCRVHGVRPAARRQRAEGAALLPHAGALRDRLGRHRRGHGLLRDGARSIPSCASSSTTGRSRRTSSCRRSWPG